MNDRKRPAQDSILSLRPAKQQRLNTDGDAQSTSIGARWKRVVKDITILGRDTIYLFKDRVAPSKTRSATPEETIREQEPLPTPSPSPELFLRPATTQSEPIPESPVPLNVAAAPSHSSLRPSPLHATTSYPSFPSSSQFSFTPRKDSAATSSQGSEFSFPTLPFVTPSSSSKLYTSSTPNLYSSRQPRKRTKTLMGPPPDPPSSHSAFSLSHSTTSLGLSDRTSGGESIRRHRSRPHILQDRHKHQVMKDRTALREELFKAKQKQGFKSTYRDFESYLDYHYQLEMAAKKRLTSPSMIDLREQYKVDEGTRLRSHSDSSVELQWIQQKIEQTHRHLELAHKIYKQPKPLTAFSPTLDQLKVRHRSKDDDIENRLRPKRVPLPPSLPSEDEAQVTAFLKKPTFIAKCAKEQVSGPDLARLRPASWLNDEVINFYGAMILGRSDQCKENKENKDRGAVNGVATAKKSNPLNVHYFNTFFWSKLEEDGYEKARLAKWTKKFDLFAKDVVLIPVNHNNMHWTAAAINFRKKRIESYDSMAMDRSTVFKRLRAYLNAEHLNKKKKPFDFTGWEDHTLEDTPQQENGFDCGVFTCQFLESLSRGEESFNFTQSDIPYLRRRMIWEIGNVKLRTDP